MTKWPSTFYYGSWLSLNMILEKNYKLDLTLFWIYTNCYTFNYITTIVNSFLPIFMANRQNDKLMKWPSAYSLGSWMSLTMILDEKTHILYLTLFCIFTNCYTFNYITTILNSFLPIFSANRQNDKLMKWPSTYSLGSWMSLNMILDEKTYILDLTLTSPKQATTT